MAKDAGIAWPVAMPIGGSTAGERAVAVQTMSMSDRTMSVSQPRVRPSSSGGWP